jgi:GNAT superfamily N-acetyltransferase
VFVADEDDKLVGFCALAHLTTCEPGECFGIGTYVYPEQRGSNLSSTLRTHAEDHCVALGHKRIVGEVSIDNLAALNSLAKHDGVTIVGVTLSKDLVKPGESELREWLSQ